MPELHIRSFFTSIFTKYRTAALSNPESIMIAVENLLLAIRKDLGHNNKNISKGKLLSTFIDNAESLYD